MASPTLRKPDGDDQAGISPRVEAAPSSETLEVTRYIAAMSVELAAMARAVDLDVLAYFLEMARIEALSIEAARRPPANPAD